MIFKDNKGHTMVEIMASIAIITLFSVTLITVNNNVLNIFSAGVNQSAEIRDLESSSEGVFTPELQAKIKRTDTVNLDYVLRIDASNTTYSTFLDPDDEYTYRGSGMYLRYKMIEFETKSEEASLAPYYLERYELYE